MATYLLGMKDLYTSERTEKLYVNEALHPGQRHTGVVQVSGGRLTTKGNRFYQYQHRGCKHDIARDTCTGPCNDNWLEYASAGRAKACGKASWAYTRSHLPEYLAAMDKSAADALLIMDGVKSASSAQAADKRRTKHACEAMEGLANSFGRLEVLVLQYHKEGTFAFDEEYDMGGSHVYERRAPIAQALCPINAIPPTPKLVRHLHAAAIELARGASTPFRVPYTSGEAIGIVQCWVRTRATSHEQLAKMDAHGRASQSILAPWDATTLPARCQDAGRAIGEGYWTARHALYHAHCSGTSSPLCKGDLVELRLTESAGRDEAIAARRRLCTKGIDRRHAVICTTWASGQVATVTVVPSETQSGSDVKAAGGFNGAQVAPGAAAIHWRLGSVVAVIWRSIRGRTALELGIERAAALREADDVRVMGVQQVLQAYDDTSEETLGVVQDMPSADGSVRIQLAVKAICEVRRLTRIAPTEGQMVTISRVTLTRAEDRLVVKAWGLPTTTDEWGRCTIPFLVGVVKRRSWDMDADTMPVTPWVCEQRQGEATLLNARPNQKIVCVNPRAMVCVVDMDTKTAALNIPPRYQTEIERHHLAHMKEQLTMMTRRNPLTTRCLAWVKAANGASEIQLLQMSAAGWSGVRYEYIQLTRCVQPKEGGAERAVHPSAVRKLAEPHDWNERGAGTRRGRYGGLAISESFSRQPSERAGLITFCIDSMDMEREQYVAIRGACEVGGMAVAGCTLNLRECEGGSESFPIARWLEIARNKASESEVEREQGDRHDTSEHEEDSSEEEEEADEVAATELGLRGKVYLQQMRACTDGPDQDASPLGEADNEEGPPARADCEYDTPRAVLHERGRAQRRLQHMTNMDQLAEGRCQAQAKREQRTALQATAVGEIPPYNRKVHGPADDRFEPAPDGALEVAANQLQLIEDCASSKNKAKLVMFEDMLDRTGLLRAYVPGTLVDPIWCQSATIAIPRRNLSDAEYDSYASAILDKRTSALARTCQNTLQAGVDDMRTPPEPQDTQAATSARVCDRRRLVSVSAYMRGLASRASKPIRVGTEQASAVQAVLHTFMRCNACDRNLAETPEVCQVAEGRVTCGRLECRHATRRRPKRMQVIAGSPGVGKSEVLLAIRGYMETNKWEYAILVVSHTGAAVSRVGGVTIDSVTRSSKKATPIESLQGDTDGPVKTRRQYNQQLCQANIGQVALVLVEEAWTTSSAQVGALHRMFLTCAGGPHNLWFGGVQLVFLGDPIQLGPTSSALPLLQPHVTGVLPRPGPGDDTFGQWLFAHAPQDVFVLYESHTGLRYKQPHTLRNAPPPM